MSIKAVIFDLDGTIVDTIFDLQKSLNIILERRNLPQASIDEAKSWIGHGLREFVRKALPDTATSEEIDMALTEMKEVYKDHLIDSSVAYPDAIEFINFLKQKNIPVAVSSNKPDFACKIILNSLFGKNTFEYILGNKKGLKHKPDPTGALLIADNLKISPEEILYIGDSDTDFYTAQNAGMKSALVTYGYGKLDEIKDIPKVDSLLELKEIFN